MGTYYKGSSQYYRSVGQNILIVSNTYDYQNGYFGKNSMHGSKSTRNIMSSDNMSTANDFYNKLTFGGAEKRVNNMRITRMADGTVITMRKVSHSDGTPVVDINIKPSSYTGGIKGQKIHFVLED